MYFRNATMPTTRTYNPFTKYPQLYREYIFHELSEKGKELFFAVNIRKYYVLININIINNSLFKLYKTMNKYNKE
jgi:hypothetical protein